MKLDDQIQASNDLINQLASPEDPALRYQVLLNLLDYPEDDPDVAHAYKNIPETPWIKKTLAAEKSEGNWNNFYQKYRGSSWVLLHLTELGTPPDLPQMRSGVQQLLATARSLKELRGNNANRYGKCTNGVYWHYPVPCITAHMAYVIIRNGHESQPITRAALEFCRYSIMEDEGVDCHVLDRSLLPACMMGTVKVLKAFSALPDSVRTSEDKEVIAKLISIILKFHLDLYVPMENTNWVNHINGKTAVTIRKEKIKWLAEGKHLERIEKKGWDRFSFPLNYNSDILEILLLLGKEKVEISPVIDYGLERLRSKRQKDGTWKMIGGLNGKMWGRLDEKGKSSPWITYRALLAFKQFNLLKIGNK
ncbi:hypothetical protein K8I28_10315 [bacterium]|nr:hypothetical protein [bacterium]